MTSFLNHQGCVAKREAWPATGTGPGSGVGWADELRRCYFALGGEAGRHGLTPDDLEAHIVRARVLLPGAPFLIEAVHVGDLALAAAICAGRAGAWEELLAEHEAILTHSAQAHLPESEAILTTRKLLCRLRRQSLDGETGLLSLRRYLGMCTLRAWLLERLVAEIYRERDRRPAEMRVERGLSPASRLRLGARLVQVDGMPVRQAARIVGLRERDVQRAAAGRLDRRQLLREMPRLERAESGTSPTS